MISEESCDTKDLNNDAEIDTNTYKKKVNLKCNISQYCICDQIDAALEVLKKTAGGQSLKVKVQGSRFFIICHIHNHTGYNP